LIIFFYGEDEFRSLEKLKEIKDKFLEKNSSGSGLSSFDFEENKDIDFSEIRKSFGTKGLFFKKQLIIIKSLISLASKTTSLAAADFLGNSKNVFDDTDLVVVFWEKGKTNEKNELFKILSKKSKNQKFDVLSGAKLINRIKTQLERENEKVKISSGAIEKLISYTGGDSRSISNEIKKLASYKEKGTVEEKEIELLVKEKTSSSIFETIEALSGGNKKNALKLLSEQIKKGEDPIYILMMYVYQFRNFLKVSEFWEKGIRNPDEIARKTGVHPFVARKILSQISNFPQEKLKDVYKKLQLIDEKVKTGKGEIKLELEKFIVEI